MAIAPDAAARTAVERPAHGGEPVYGINTGFGSFAEVMIAQDALAALHVNLLRSHAAGVGRPLSVGATMALRTNVLAKEFSDIWLETLEALLALLLIGEGEAWDGTTRIAWAEALRRAGLAPIALGPKEGLAVINGTQPSTAALALALADAEQLAPAADIAAAMSIDALRGSIHPFEARVQASRPFPGQMTSAANIERLIRGSWINRSHALCGRVQDAYSLRCAAQVHGATREALRFVSETVDVEANAFTDNPMVFAETGDIVSCGNFHGAPVALAADLLAATLVPMATISERCTDRPRGSDTQRPAGIPDASGWAQIGLHARPGHDAAVASELKALAHPSGADTIPTSANKEDHVSMSMTAALKAERAVRRAREVTAIEILCACQAINLLTPFTTSPPLAATHALVRARVPTLDEDRQPAPDILAITELIARSDLKNACVGLVK